MAVAVTAGELKALVSGLQSFPWGDAQAAIGARLKNVPDDVAVGEDVLGVLGAFFPNIMVLQIALAVFGWVIENNQSIEPGALAPIASGKRGSDTN